MAAMKAMMQVVADNVSSCGGRRSVIRAFANPYMIERSSGSRRYR